jgi:hypothetical protein
MSRWQIAVLLCPMAIAVSTAQTGVTQKTPGKAATSPRSASQISPALDARQLPPGGFWIRKPKPDGSGETWTYNFTIADDQQNARQSLTAQPNGRISSFLSRPLDGAAKAGNSSASGGEAPGSLLGLSGDSAPRTSIGPMTVPERGTTLFSVGTTQARSNKVSEPASNYGSSNTSSNFDAVGSPPVGGLIQRRFILDTDPRQPSTASAESWFEFWLDATDGAVSPAEIASMDVSRQRGWVRVDEPAAALLRSRGIPYRRINLGSLAGIPAGSLGMTVGAGFSPAVAHLPSSFPLASATAGRPGVSAFDINFEDQPHGGQASSVRFYLKLSHPHLDQINIWLVAGDREAVLWDGRGGSYDAGFDDDPENDSNITLNRVLSKEMRGVSLSGHWTLYISNGDQDAAGALEEFWLVAAARNVDFETESIRAASALDIVAQRAYLKSAAGGGGSEILSPALGQTVYFTLDWQLNGSGAPVAVSERALLDGGVFCSFSATVGVGSYISSCNSGWAVASGTHTLEWDLDYTNVVSETNEGNNTAVAVFTPMGLDIIAQRAYFRTAPQGGGSEVPTPSLGQTVYFTADWQIAGASNAVTSTNRALLDGSTFCSGSSTLGNGAWISWCTNGWTATGGSHTLEWDFDYSNQLAEINENNNSSTTFFTTSGVDLVAQRAYLRTAAGSGIEVSAPSLGQTVYFTVDWLISGANGTLNVPLRMVLDGVTFCTFSSTLASGSWTSWCGTGWVATGGTHTLEWDLDYTNSIPETDENNNTTVASITTAGTDIVAQRAYLRTAAGGGTEITIPTAGQTVYFTVDWLLSGANGTLNVPLRAVLDGGAFCTFTSALASGSWTSWCGSGWVATGGTHTLEWDLNYNNSISEINYTNNRATDVFTITGADIAAQRAYLKTAAGAGSEVTAPALGQTVYFTVDWLLTGASNTLAVPLRALLDGVTFCSDNALLSSGAGQPGVLTAGRQPQARTVWSGTSIIRTLSARQTRTTTPHSSFFQPRREASPSPYRRATGR